MSDVIAYFVTWTTYGTWLPGDERGWQQWHQGWQRPNPGLESYAKSIMTESSLCLTSDQRLQVDETVRKHCDIRSWHLWAANCRTTHVHVVITADNASGETVRDQLKAWCTRNLKSSFDRDRENWWAEGGYIASIDNEDDLASAIRYTLDAQ